MKTLPVVNRDQSTALFAPVFFILFLNESADSLLLYQFEILYHAHFIVISVPVIYTSDLHAGIPVAFETKNRIFFYGMIDSGTLGE